MDEYQLSNRDEARTFGPLFRLRRIGRILGLQSMSLSTKIGKIYVRPRDSDADSFIQVFIRRPYDLSGFPQYNRVVAAYKTILDRGGRPVIVDAGANVGAASRWFSMQFPEAAIVAIEPDHGNALLCRKNLQHLSNVEVVEAAIGSVAGSVTVIGNPESLAIRTERASDGRVPVITIPDAINRVVGGNGSLFIAKIDIEGFESDLFAENTEWVASVPVLLFEPHDWLFPGHRTSRNLLKVLSGIDHEMLIVSGDTLAFVH
jgi:FkbM family methyltransferase